jgi:hypothetical protein
VVVAFLCLGRATYFLLAGLSHPIVGFRETQTAISAYWLWRGGPWLAYETPVFGFPWSLPFEFPTYQWLVALMKWFGVPIEIAGRIISFAFYIGCLGPLWLLVRELKFKETAFWIIAILFLSSPIYLFWSRSVMIETCAVFFSLLWLALVTRYLNRPTIGILVTAVIAGSLATLTKATTFPAFGLLGAILVLVEAFVAWRGGFLFTRLKSLTLASFTAIAALAIAYAWVVYTDHLKLENALTIRLTSANLTMWTFGPFDQRFGASLWRDTIYSRALPDIFGYGVFGAIFALGCAVACRRSWLAILALVVAFFAPFLVFTNLHVVHPYYQIANAALAVMAVGIGIASLNELKRPVLAILTLAAICSGQFFYFRETYAPQIADDMRNNSLVHMAKLVKENTSPDSAILVMGLDWSPTVAYLSERKSVYIPGWIPLPMLDAILKDPESVLGGLRLGIVVRCKDPQFYSKTESFFSDRRVIAALGECSLLAPN